MYLDICFIFSSLCSFIQAQVLKDLPERDPMDFVTVEAGSVSKGRWAEVREGGEDGAGAMDEDEEVGSKL